MNIKLKMNNTVQILKPALKKNPYANYISPSIFLSD